LNALQRENDAVAVLQRRHLAAADESAAGARSRISAGDGAGARQIAGRADQIDRRDAEAAETDAADGQPISVAIIKTPLPPPTPMMNPTLTMCRRTVPVVCACEGVAAPSSMTANDTAAAAIFIARVKTSIDASRLILPFRSACAEQ
jgi:hypothetical protein